MTDDTVDSEMLGYRCVKRTTSWSMVVYYPIVNCYSQSNGFRHDSVC